MLTSNETKLFASLQGLNTTQTGRDIVRIIESFRWMTHTENESNTYPKLQVQTIGIGPFYLITAQHSISGHALISEIGCADAVLSMSIAPRQHTRITHRDNVAVDSTKWSEWYDYRSPWEWSPEPDRIRPYQTADLWVRWEDDSPWERIQLPMEIVLWGILGAMDRQDVTEEELIRDVLLVLRDGEENEIENLAPQAALWVRRDLESFAVIPAGVLESSHPTADQWIEGKTVLRQAWRSRNMSLWTKLTRQTAINRWVCADTDSTARQHGELTLVKSGVSTRTGTRKMYYRYINDMPQPEAIQESPEVYKSIPYVELTDADSGFSLKAFSLPMMIRKLGLIGGHEMFLKVIEVPDNAITNEMVKDIYVEAMLANRGYDLGIRTEKVSVKYHSGLDTDVLPRD